MPKDPDYINLGSQTVHKDFAGSTKPPQKVIKSPAKKTGKG